MVKVYIDMDHSFRWWPIMENDPTHAYWRKDMTFEVSAELLAEYNIAHTLYQNVQEKLEALYRIQTGYEPHPNQVVPEHKLLKEKSEL